jgi:hypothetical protein
LHAICNHELDLQAWYHAIFFNEVYRLRGPFWYKDAVLPIYRTSYDIIDNSLTPLEESALAQVLCSPDTVYGDVAGQMFIVQAITTPIQFQLFQNLASQGATVIKYPHSGRPAKKLFRFSFVEGKIYLTWKGKFGNQGVDLGEVHQIQLGMYVYVYIYVYMYVYMYLCICKIMINDCHHHCHYYHHYHHHHYHRHHYYYPHHHRHHHYYH